MQSPQDLRVKEKQVKKEGWKIMHNFCPNIQQETEKH